MEKKYEWPKQETRRSVIRSASRVLELRSRSWTQRRLPSSNIISNINSELNVIKQLLLLAIIHLNSILKRLGDLKVLVFIPG